MGDHAGATSWRDVCGRRLARHGLTAPLPDLDSAARALCGVHAQVQSAAELSLCLRVPGAHRSDISLVRTYGPRGTVHLFAADDAGLFMAATAHAGLDDRTPGWLTSIQRDQVVAEIGTALAARDLTIDELGEAVTGALDSWAADAVVPAFGGYWPRWRSAVGSAAYAGVLCFGASRGRTLTYGSPHRLVPGFHRPPGPTALAEVVRRYLRSYGPASADHFAKWMGMRPSAAARAFQSIVDDLALVTLDGESMYVNADDADFPPRSISTVRLLPHFDGYVVGCHPRSKVFPADAAARALKRGQAGTVPTVLVDGEVAGVWHHQRRGRRLSLTVETLRTLAPAQRRRLDDEVARLGEIFDAVPELTLGPVTAGHHL